MYVRFLTSLLLLLILKADAQMIPVTRFTSREAVFAERVNCMAQDNKGYMWFGSYFGIMRYDGYEWKKIELPEEMRNRFVATMVASGDTIYAGISFGGGFLQWQNGKARKIPLPEPFNLVTKTCRKTDGNITLVLFAENEPNISAIYNYRDNQFTPLWNMPPRYQNISDIKWDKDQRLWIGTSAGLLIRNQDGSVEEKIPGIEVVMILVNEDESMVVGAVKNGKPVIFHSNKNVPFQEKEIEVDLLHIYGNNKDGFWAFHKQKGLVRLDKNMSESHYRFDIPPKTVVGCIFIDRERNLWLSSEAGLFRFSQINAKSFWFRERGPSTGYINTLPEGWLIHNGFSLYYFDGDLLRPVSSLKKTGNLGNGYIDREGNTWMLQWGDVKSGIWKTTWKNSRLLSSSYINKFNGELIHPSDLVQLTDYDFFISGSKGIYVMRNEKVVQFFPVKIQGKSIQNFKLCLDEKRNFIWTGTNGKGILKIAYRKLTSGQYDFKIIQHVYSGNGLKDDFIRGRIILDKRGRLWFGSRNAGLTCLEEKEDSIRLIHFGEKEGLGCVRTNHIVEMDGDIWTSTCDGIYHIRDDKVIRRYYSGDGLIGNDIHHFVLNHEKLLAVTSEGITSLQFAEPDFEKPTVTISGISVMGNSNADTVFEGMDLPADQNAIGFEFTANSFIDEKGVRYRYMLEGYDRHWSEPVTANKINYASLRAGSYTFKVISQNAKGVWSPTPASFRFQIVQSFYRTTAFYIIIAFLLLLIAWGIGWYRREQRKKLEKMRMTIARDLHDDIGSALGSINILSRTAQRKISEDKEAEAVVNKIGTTAQKTLESMDEIIWTINPMKEKALDLVIRMQSFAQPLLESAGIEFHFSTNFHDNQKLDMEMKRNLYLIFKELVYNAIKHANCTNLYVKLNHSAGQLELIIEDDGLGLQTPTASGRNGLSNISERAGLLKGDFRLSTREPKGTVAVVTVPAE